MKTDTAECYRHLDRAGSPDIAAHTRLVNLLTANMTSIAIAGPTASNLSCHHSSCGNPCKSCSTPLALQEDRLHTPAQHAIPHPAATNVSTSENTHDHPPQESLYHACTSTARITRIETRYSATSSCESHARRAILRPSWATHPWRAKY